MAIFSNVRSCATVGLGLLGLLSGLSSCGSGHEADCLKSNGPVTMQRRELPITLRKAILYDNVDVTIVPDTVNYAEVWAGKNVIDDITLTMQGPQQLEVRNTSRCNWVRSYDTPHEVRLHVRYLHDIEPRGYGLLTTASQFRQDTLFIHSFGAGDTNMDVQSQYLSIGVYDTGDMTLRGTANEFYPGLGGNGFLFASDLRANYCYYHIYRENIGDGHVRASINLSGLHLGRGTLYYSGTPGYIEPHGPGRLVAE